MIPNVIYYIVCMPLCVVVNLEQEKLRTPRKSSSILPTLLPEVPSKRSRQVTDDVDAFFSSHNLDHCLHMLECGLPMQVYWLPSCTSMASVCTLYGFWLHS